MKALIDGDILRYEIGFAAETGWRAITEDDDALPPFDYVREMLLMRLHHICDDVGANEYCIFLTEGKTFRYDIATVKPYKGSRKDNKPWHFNNLTVYIRDVLPSKVVTFVEADDALAIEHLDPATETVLCSRDKDLRMVPGNFYSWELGQQPSYGPLEITPVGHLTLDKSKKQPKLTGSGLAWFCAQCLTGDSVDNIPGLPKCGPVAAYAALSNVLDLAHDEDIPNALLKEVEFQYQVYYGDEWEERLLEQGRLLWMTRKYNEDGSPELWELGKTS